MAAKLLTYLWKRWSRGTVRPGTAKGFTLIELLVTTLIAGFLITGLMYLVVELMQTNQRETARTETQREMRLGLDYIANELREAVYVYPGECIDTGVGAANDANFCPGLGNHITFPTNSTPVLAFWKLDPLPDEILNFCAAQTGDDPNFQGVPCLSGKSFTLVMYFFSIDNPTDKWKGEARLVRLELPHFQNQNNPAALTPGYVPIHETDSFRAWPFLDGIDAQAGGQAAGTTAVLVDFVSLATNGMVPVCPGVDVYSISPEPANPSERFSFYACVRDPDDLAGFNQDSILYLKGNAKGKPGVRTDGFLPTLSTQVLNRGVVDKSPPTN